MRKDERHSAQQKPSFGRTFFPSIDVPKDSETLKQIGLSSYKALLSNIQEAYRIGLPQTHTTLVQTYPDRQDLKSEARHRLLANTQKPTRFGKTLYVHIPYCTGICTYCGFARTATSDSDSKITNYLEALAIEFSLMQQLFADAESKIPVESIYIGGGTPTLLNSKDLRQLFQMIQRTFLLKKFGEYTLETSPETVDREKIMLAKDFGVNRISMGVESFDDNILAFVGRRHKVSDIYKMIELYRDCGIDHIDIDLIRNIPTTTIENVLSDLHHIQQLEIPSITSYEYVLKSNTIDYKRRLRGEFGLISNKDRMVHHLAFIAVMEALGYLQQPIEWHIKDERYLYQQQMQKWNEQSDLLALGISGYGFINGYQYENYSSTKAYFKAISDGELPIERAIYHSKEEQHRRHLIFGIRCGINRNETKKRYGQDMLVIPGVARVLKNLTKAGLVCLTPDSLELTLAGTLVIGQIQRALFRPLP